MEPLNYTESVVEEPAAAYKSTETYHHMALSLVPKIGPVLGKTLISYCGGAEAVFKEKKNNLLKIPGMGDLMTRELRSFTSFSAVDDELKFAEKYKIRILPYTHSAYPSRLKQALDSPLVLFVKGDADLNHHRMTGIVGTRRNTDLGTDSTRNLVNGLKPYDSYIVSGLAYGIDICAHKTAIACDLPTIGVVAHGLDLIYPAKHRSIAEEMLEKGGAIVSEFFSGTPLHPDLFPRRNRIVAGMCDALIVIESMKKGGSMITADIAFSYNRDVFAVPGRPGDIMSEGCNLLIKSLKAGMAESAIDVARGMNWPDPGKKSRQQASQAQLFSHFSSDEMSVIHHLQDKILHIDTIAEVCKIPVHRLAHILLELEMKDAIESRPGMMYRQKRA
ncbi:MAG: DNA-protecting protein DprA [Bacteroidetes bacterium]|nr:DNA-protecting protein DprA [Bacteroidota bacterium]